MARRLFQLGISACLFILIGCALRASEARFAPDVTLEEAQALITSGQVVEIFQPHQGCVVLTLKDGRYMSFEQPHLDWVLSYVEENGLSNSISISVE